MKSETTARKIQLVVVAAVVGCLGTYMIIRSFAAQTPVTQPPNSTPSIGFDRIAIGTNADFSNVSADGKRYKFVILQSWRTDVLAKLKAADPNVKVLAYYNLTGMVYPDSTGKYSGCVDPTGAPEQYFLHNLNNQRFTFQNYPKIWAANQGDPGYQQACADHVISDTAAKGFDGAMLDDTNYSIKYHYTPSQVKEYPTDALYGAATKSAVASIGPRITAAGKLAIPNVGTYAEFADFNDSLLPYVSGLQDEYFVSWASGSLQPGSNRNRAIEGIAHAESLGKFYLANTPGATADDTKNALYGLASAMLASDNYATFGFNVGANYGTADPPWLPEFDLAESLGQSKGAYYLSGSVQRRDFYNGTVLANPTGTTQNVSLGGSYSGSGLTNVTTVSMPPQTGLILQSDPPKAIRGDVTGPSGIPDGKVDIYDLSYVIRNYNTADPKADVTGPSGAPDGKVDIYDLSYIIRNYGE